MQSGQSNFKNSVADLHSGSEFFQFHAFFWKILQNDFVFFVSFLLLRPVDPVHEQYALSSPWIVSSEHSTQFNSSSTAKLIGLILVTCTFGVFTN